MKSLPAYAMATQGIVTSVVAYTECFKLAGKVNVRLLSWRTEVGLRLRPTLQPRAQPQYPYRVPGATNQCDWLQAGT